VRRLVRQYELDITGIHGTGPSGRIRVGDLMGLLGGRTEPNNRFTDTASDLTPDLEDREPDTAPRFAPPRRRGARSRGTALAADEHGFRERSEPCARAS
jgi:pyruvate/2-oxoglutarate dehydrogenase complex dihydrolipoamide acyltransferase (E2) component